MTLTQDALADIAAIAATLPDPMVRLGTSGGGMVVVGAHPHGALCPDAFRHVMASWDSAYAPAVDSVAFAGAVYEAGVLSRPRQRLFATRLRDDQVALFLRTRDDWPRGAHATVRQDVLLGRAIVSVFSDELTEEELDDAVRIAQGACLVEELLQGLPRT